MSNFAKQSRILILAGAFVTLGTAAAVADDYSSDSSYNHPYGMQSGQENTLTNPSLRDANGNLTVVNGQFTSSAYGQQTMSSAGSSLANLGTQQTGVGSGSTATAIGNSLNVVTVGNWNTVVVNSNQSNTGAVTATTSTGTATSK